MKKRDFFVDGPISPQFVGESIARHQKKTSIGAHDIFLGQVRQDSVADKLVQAIEYTAYQEMAEPVLSSIMEEAFDQFELTCAHVYHSLGRINIGEICLFVFTSAPRRRSARQACTYIVEAIKEQVPIFGKELLGRNDYQWKVNT
ncbi:MAG: molybdenum cofactor biosynthesis protein MoaE [Cyclobacteriaceae bacterium]|nr:molybdenum cofactor biosynthesis protein MoaE [Cyclobacteriaceae bacterium HetDA_MAG_MS6]